MTDLKGTIEWMGSCYGVDIQAGKPVIVRAERTRGHVDFFPVTQNDPVFIEGIRSGKAAVAGSLTAGESFACWLEAPFPAFQKAVKVLPTLLDVQLPFPLEDCIYSFIEGGRDDAVRMAGKTRAIAVAARTAEVQKKIETFSAFGVDPVVLDQEGLAIWTQSLAEVPAGKNSTTAPRVVIYLGVERSTLVIGRGTEFVSAHGMGQGNTAQIDRLLKTQLAAGQGGAGIQWMWAGPGAADALLLKKLGDSLYSRWPGSSVVHDKPETFLARAVAGRALLPGPLRCNLRSGPLLHPVIARKAERDVASTALTYLAAGLLLCGINVTWDLAVKHRETALDKEAGALAERLAGSRAVSAKGSTRLKMVRDAMSPRKDKMKPFMRNFEPSLAETIAAMTDLARKNDLNFEILSISRDKINVSGTAGNWKKCESLKDFLKQKGYTVKLDRKESLASERVAFFIASTGEGKVNE